MTIKVYLKLIFIKLGKSQTAHKIKHKLSMINSKFQERIIDFVVLMTFRQNKNNPSNHIKEV